MKDRQIENIYNEISQAVSQSDPDALLTLLASLPENHELEWVALFEEAIHKLRSCFFFDAKEKKVFEILLRQLAKEFQDQSIIGCLSTTARDIMHILNPHTLFGNQFLPQRPRHSILDNATAEHCLELLVDEKYKMSDLLSEIKMEGGDTLLDLFRKYKSPTIKACLAMHAMNTIRKMDISRFSTWGKIMAQDDIDLDALLINLNIKPKNLCRISLDFPIIEENPKMPLFLFLMSVAPDLGSKKHTGFVKIIELMLERDPSIVQCKANMKSAMQLYLSREGLLASPPSPEICRLLIRYGSNPNELVNGSPVFHKLFNDELVKNQNWFDCLKIMVEGCADVSLCNAAGDNALDLALHRSWFTESFRNVPNPDMHLVSNAEVSDYLERKMNAKRLRTFALSANLFASQNNLCKIPKGVMNYIAGYVYNNPRK